MTNRSILTTDPRAAMNAGFQPDLEETSPAAALVQQRTRDFPSKHVVNMGDPTFGERREIMDSLAAPVPHVSPNLWIDEYEVHLGRKRREEVMKLVTAGMVGAQRQETARPSPAQTTSGAIFPISNLPARLKD